MILWTYHAWQLLYHKKNHLYFRKKVNYAALE